MKLRQRVEIKKSYPRDAEKRRWTAEREVLHARFGGIVPSMRIIMRKETENEY